METDRNKRIVLSMYEFILNRKEHNQLDHFIDKDYIKEFSSSNELLFTTFPDIKFEIKQIFGEGIKVITFYEWTGTHQNEYFNITSTHKNVIIEGVSIYGLRDGKIIHNAAKPDKLSFYLQLGIIPHDFLKEYFFNDDVVYFVDEFVIPKKSFNEFKEKLIYNRNSIKNLKGFIRDEVILNNDHTDVLTVITIAVWKEKRSLDDARETVLAEYERIGFSVREFNQKYNIKMERKIFSLWR